MSGLDEKGRDWTEDFADENGNYQCHCVKCGHLFTGYKRRVVCKLCSAPPAPGGLELPHKWTGNGPGIRGADNCQHVSASGELCGRWSDEPETATCRDSLSAQEAEIERLRAQAERIRELEEDAARYRWLRDNEGGRSNRWPHVTQYPYQPEIDRFRPPQIMRDMQYRGEYLDEAIDAARAAPPEHLLSAHACSLLRAKEETR